MIRSVAHTGLDVVVAGLAVVDLIGRPVNLWRLPKRGGIRLTENITMVLGGNVCNVGIDLAKLGFRTGAVTRIGDDPLGKFVLRELSRNGIDKSGVITDPTAQTSATMVFVDRSGERTFIHSRGCMKNFGSRDIMHSIGLLKRARIICFGYLGLLPELEPRLGALFKLLKSKTSAEIVLDTGGLPPRMSRSRLSEFLPYVDYFFPSHSEASMLTGLRAPEEIAEFLFSAGAPNIVGIKSGSKGCFIASRSKGIHIKPARVGKIVDATGAGDAFIAGFIAGTLKGLPPEGAAGLGNVVAADCLKAVGASTAIKNIRRYLN
jgi:sugar/nucleoside kinase (ribokinase family)